MFCKKCAAQIEEGTKFCGNCGTQIEVLPDMWGSVSGEGTENVADKQPKKKKTGIIVGAIVLLLAILIAGGIALKNVNEKNRYEELLEAGNKYFEELDYEAAEAVYLEAISIDPRQEEPYLILADIYVAQNEPEKAQEILEQAQENVIYEEGEKNKIQDKQDEIVGYIEYEWVVEPQVEADDIYYVVADGDDIENNNYKQMMLSYAVIEKDGMLGVIDMSGELLGDMDYERIHMYYDMLMLERKTPVYEAGYQMEWSTYTLYNGQIEPIDGLGGGMMDNSYYFCGGIQNHLEAYIEEYDYPYDFVVTPKNSIPVIEFDRILTVDDYMALRPFNDESDRYGVFTDGHMVTEFEFEQCGSFESGLLAAKKDGKWGYVNESGEVVIPFEYDASWDKFETYTTGGFKFFDYAYSATDGYVVLNKAGSWLLCDTDGNVRIPEGVFEKICPVFDGRCWVKQDGKWGVIELIDNDEDAEAADETVDFHACLEGVTDVPVQGMEIEDFDSDGTMEAFAFTAQNVGSENLHNDVTIWYIDAEGNCTPVLEETYGYFQGLVVAEDKTFFVWEQYAGGSSSLSHILGVENGNMYMPQISGMYGSFSGSDGAYNALDDDFSSGYHQYDAIFFEFDGKEFIESGREENIYG